jgi:hypothetical protein
VIVDLDEAGKVIHAKVGMHSALLDNPDAEAAFEQAALNAVNGSTFSAKIVECKAVNSRYLYKITFNPTPHS